MRAIFTEQFDERRTWEETGDEVVVVSLFECGTQAWDATKMTDEQIEEMLNSDDIEEYAYGYGIEKVDIEYAAGNNGSDNDWCVIAEQDDRKSIVRDVDGTKLYEGGLREYMDSFGECFTACQYWDGSNWQLAFDEDQGEGSVKVELA